MTLCTFADFYAACRERLTDAQLRTLDPKASYFKMDSGGYCGLLIEESRTWISILVGEMADVWGLRRELINAEMPLAGFKCRPDSPTLAIARYYGAKVEEIDEKYPDGAPVMRCLIQRQHSKRLAKMGEKATALA